MAPPCRGADYVWCASIRARIKAFAVIRDGAYVVVTRSAGWASPVVVLLCGGEVRVGLQC